MPAPPVDRNGVGTVGAVLLDRLLGIELLLQLVEIGDFEVGAVAHRAAHRRQLPEQNPQQRRLADSVRTDQPDLVASEDGCREIAHDGRSAEVVADVGRLEHEITRPSSLLHFDARPAEHVAAPAAPAAQFLQGAHTAFVPGAPRLDAGSDPLFFLGQFLVEQRVAARLGLECGRLATQVRLEIALPTGQFAAVHLDDARGQRLQEHPIVRDEYNRCVESAQKPFEPIDRGYVEMVGRLVQQKNVRGAGQGSGQQHAPLGAGRDGLERVEHRQLDDREDLAQLQQWGPSTSQFDLSAQLVQLAPHRVVGWLGRSFQFERQTMISGNQVGMVVQAGRHHVDDGTADRLGHRLRKPRRAQASGPDDLAVVGLQLTVEQPQQGRFSGAVAADQRNPLSGIDAKIGPIDQRRPGKSEGRVAKRQQCHTDPRRRSGLFCRTPAFMGTSIVKLPAADGKGG